MGGARTLAAITLVTLALGPARADAAPGASKGFVAVRGTGFVLDGRPFRFVGANVGVMHGPSQRKHYRKTLQAARDDGLSVVRIWALGEGPSSADRWHRRWQLLRAGPRGWIPGGLRHLDRVVAHARKLGLRVILTLGNNWSDYGGVPQYLRWARLGAGSRYADLDRFYRQPRTRRWYRRHVVRLVDRRSAVTRVRYGDDPTIMSWELFNESTATPSGFAARRTFLAEMAKLIRSKAPRQLVSAGVTGYGTPTRRDEWLRVCKLKDLSYCDAHLYPEDTWRLQRPADLEPMIDDRAQLAMHVAGRPLVFGEFGFSDALAKRRRLGHTRAWWTRRFLRRVLLDRAAGALVWLYLPHCKERRRFPIWVDHPSSAALRKAIRTEAARFRAGPPRGVNRRLGKRWGTRSVYPSRFSVHRKRAKLAWRVVTAKNAGPTRAWLEGAEGLRLQVPVGRFVRARFYEMGHHASGWVSHVYGAGFGFWEYPIPRTKVPVNALFLRIRLSSEYPGASAPAGGKSQVVVKLFGRTVARIEAAPDDGKGRAVTIRVTDHQVLTSLQKRGTRLRLEVPKGKDARGLCVYGRLGAAGAKRPGAVKGYTGPIDLLATITPESQR